MVRPLIIFTFAIVLLSSSSTAQSTTSASPSPSPTPTPATRRPTLDQFGLSTGAFAGPASTANAETTAKTEYVDQETFDAISQVIEKSKFMEAELLKALRENVDISPTSRFPRYFERDFLSLMTISEAQRTGRFGGAGIKDGDITKLLQQNEQTAFEIVGVLYTDAGIYSRFSGEVDAITEKYGVPLLAKSADGMRLDKPALLKAMMARINASYARVKKQIAVRK